MRLVTQAKRAAEAVVPPPHRTRKGEHVARLNPPHQNTAIPRKGPVPKRSDCCATESTAPAPSARRIAAP
jgi:hypothetical protein